MSSASASQRWAIERFTGSAADFHAHEPEAGAGRLAWWCDVVAPALVLGSAQPERTVDVDACHAAGITVARRRSGGGAVLMLPGDVLWLDVVVPRGDLLWDDDVGRSMWWFGDVWAQALGSLGVEATVHHGPLRRTDWSSVVCFDGLGAGEVVVGGAKAVGISQRRTRHWARMQSALHLRWRPDVLVALLAPPAPSVDDLGSVWSAPLAAEQVRAAVERGLQAVRDGQERKPA